MPENGAVYVTAGAPGVAHVRVDGCCGDLSTITVLPRVAVEIYAQTTRVPVGQPVVITALAEIGIESLHPAAQACGARKPASSRGEVC